MHTCAALRHGQEACVGHGTARAWVAFPLQAHAHAWDAAIARATGPALYTSAAVTAVLACRQSHGEHRIQRSTNLQVI